MICHDTAEGGCIEYNDALATAISNWVKAAVKKAFNYTGTATGSDGWWSGKFHYHAPENEDSESGDEDSETGDEGSGSDSGSGTAGHWCWGGTRYTAQAGSLQVYTEDGASITAKLKITVTNTGRTYHDINPD